MNYYSKLVSFLEKKHCICKTTRKSFTQVPYFAMKECHLKVTSLHASKIAYNNIIFQN